MFISLSLEITANVTIEMYICSNLPCNLLTFNLLFQLCNIFGIFRELQPYHLFCLSVHCEMDWDSEMNLEFGSEVAISLNHSWRHVQCSWWCVNKAIFFSLWKSWSNYHTNCAGTDCPHNLNFFFFHYWEFSNIWTRRLHYIRRWNVQKLNNCFLNFPLFGGFFLF